jgi:TPR repeat protein
MNTAAKRPQVLQLRSEATPWPNPISGPRYSGKGAPQDFAEAVKWFRKAAEQGDAEAQNNLGAIYAQGQGVQRDYIRA